MIVGLVVALGACSGSPVVTAPAVTATPPSPSVAAAATPLSPSTPGDFQGFAKRVVAAVDRLNAISAAHQTSTNPTEAVAWAADLDAFAVAELGWLAANPPAVCYQAAHEALTKEYEALRKYAPLLSQFGLDPSQANVDAMQKELAADAVLTAAAERAFQSSIAACAN